MWDDYADRCRGVCIPFHARPDSPFRFAQNVIYQEQRPELRVPFRGLTEDEIGDRVTRTKTLKWQHETEFRWIRYPDIDFADTGFHFEGQHAHFPATAIAGITVGADMPADDIESLKKIAAAHQPRLPLFRPRGLIIRPGDPAFSRVT